MPRKKRNDRTNDQNGEGLSPKWQPSNSQVPGLTGAQSGPDLRTQNDTNDQQKEQKFHYLQDMFKEQIDPEVVYMVLSECDFKVEETIEKLLQLSAEGSDTKNDDLNNKLSMKSIAHSITMSATVDSEHQSNQPSHVQSGLYSAPPPVLSMSSADYGEMAAQVAHHFQDQGYMPRSEQRSTPQEIPKDNLRLNLKSRLPSSDNSANVLPMLSPRTPSTAAIDPFSQSLESSNNTFQTALQALHTYANNPAKGMIPEHTPMEVQGTSYFDLPVGAASAFSSIGVNGMGGQERTTDGVPDLQQNGAPITATSGMFDGDPCIRNAFGMDNFPGAQTAPTTNEDDKMLPGILHPIMEASPDRIQAGTWEDINQQYFTNNTNHKSLSKLQYNNSDQEKNSSSSSTVSTDSSGKKSSTIRRFRKYHSSLDPQERESLEKLIETVILGGLEEGMGDSDGSSAYSDTDSDSPGGPEKEAKSIAAGSIIVSPGVEIIIGPDGNPITGTVETVSRNYQSQLKVAQKHMKNLPPRFQRKLHAPVKGKTGSQKSDDRDDEENYDDEYLEGMTGDDEHQHDVFLVDQSEKSDPKPERSERKKEKKEKTNMLKCLDDYIGDYESENSDFDFDDVPEEGPLAWPDDLPEVEEQELPQRTAPPPPKRLNSEQDIIDTILNQSHDFTSPDRTVIRPNAFQAIVGDDGQSEQDVHMLSNKNGQNDQAKPTFFIQSNAVNCEDLERELLAQAPNLAEVKIQHEQRQPPWKQRQRYSEPPSIHRVAGGSQTGHTDNAASVASAERENTGSLQPSSSSQFSIDAPVFVPRAATPVSMTPVVPGMPTRVSPGLQALNGSPVPQPPVSHAVAAAAAAGAYAAAMGRMSPSMPTHQQVAAMAAAQGRHSPMLLQKVAHGTPMAGPHHGPVPVLPYQQYPVHPYMYPGPRHTRPGYLPHLGFGAFSADRTAGKGVPYPFPHKMTPAEHAQWLAHLVNQRPNSAPTAVGLSPRMAANLQPQTVMGLVRHMQRLPLTTRQLVERVNQLAKEKRKVMVILRGLPGSGKSTLAKEMECETGAILSSDDYFMNGDKYEYDFSKIAEAHEYNQNKAKEMATQGKTPIIIDNTNTKVWEMKPYVVMGLENGYLIELMEPDTTWKFRPKELAMRNRHSVTQDAIQRMLDRYDHNIIVENIIASVEKPRREELEKIHLKLITRRPGRKRKRKKRKRARDKSGQQGEQEGQTGKEKKTSKEEEDVSSEDEEGESKSQKPKESTSKTEGVAAQTAASQRTSDINDNVEGVTRIDSKEVSDGSGSETEDSENEREGSHEDLSSSSRAKHTSQSSEGGVEDPTRQAFTVLRDKLEDYRRGLQMSGDEERAGDKMKLEDFHLNDEVAQITRNAPSPASLQK